MIVNWEKNRNDRQWLLQSTITNINFNHIREMKEALVAIEIKERELCTQKPNKENTKRRKEAGRK